MQNKDKGQDKRQKVVKISEEAHKLLWKLRNKSYEEGKDKMLSDFATDAIINQYGKKKTE